LPSAALLSGTAISLSRTAILSATANLNLCAGLKFVLSVSHNGFAGLQAL
jgi:hypothetical protein